MSYGLQVFNPSGTLSFDSNDALGGVCLGFVTVPGVGGVYDFTDITDASAGRVVPNALYGWDLDVTIATSPNLKFTFPNTGQSRPVALFAL